jgi:hypothetical protein
MNGAPIRAPNERVVNCMKRRIALGVRGKWLLVTLIYPTVYKNSLIVTSLGNRVVNTSRTTVV